MLCVEDVPDHRPEWEIHLYGPLDQLKGYLWFGAKLGIFLTTLEVVGRSVGLDLLQRIVEPLVGVHGAYRDHSIVCLSHAAEVLDSHMSGGLGVLTYSPVSSISRAPDLVGAVSWDLRASTAPCDGSPPQGPSRTP
jgi:hypothetical protein